MAVIGKIRQRTGLLLGVIVVGMSIYILGDMLSGSSRVSSNEDQVAIIDGNDVSRDLYQNIKIQTTNLYQNRNNQPEEYYQASMNRAAWEKILLEYAYIPEFRELGLEISNDPNDPERGELVDMVQGSTMSPTLVQQFGASPEDPSAIVNYMDQLASIDLEDPNLTAEQRSQQAQQKQGWSSFIEREVIDKRWTSKYETLLEKSTYVTTAEAKRAHANQNTSMSLEHVYLPFARLADSVVEVTDADIEQYAKSHAAQYAAKQEERVIKYVVFDINPKGRDTLAAEQKAQQVVEKLKTQKNAAAFARVQSDDKNVFKNGLYEDLPFQIKMDSASVDSGSVYGPFTTLGGYTAYKIINVLDTTAAASHILFTTQGLDDAAKQSKLIKAELVLQRALDGEDFTTLASTNSEGPSAKDGGKLGDFGKADMVAAFSDAIWARSSTGVIPEIVESEFGYHIINVTRAPSVKPKYYYVEVKKNITPGQQTRDEVYSQANMALSKIGEDVSGFENLDSTFKVKTAANISIDNSTIAGIPDSKNLIYWAFRSEQGMVSDKAELLGKKYVIAGLSDIIARGEVNVEKNRKAIEIKVRGEKKAEILVNMLKESSSDDLKATAEKVNSGDNKLLATYQNVASQSFNSSYVSGASDEPTIVGIAFGLKEGAVSPITIGDKGVFIVKAGTKTDPSSTPDSFEPFVSSVKGTRFNEKNGYRDVIIDNIDIEDYRYKVSF